MNVIVSLDGNQLELTNLPDDLGLLLRLQQHEDEIWLDFSGGRRVIWKDGTIRYEQLEDSGIATDSGSDESAAAPPVPDASIFPVPPPLVADEVTDSESDATSTEQEDTESEPAPDPKPKRRRSG